METLKSKLLKMKNEINYTKLAVKKQTKKLINTIVFIKAASTNWDPFVSKSFVLTVNESLNKPRLEV